MNGDAVDYEAVRVHVTNPEQITFRTEEKEPEHFVFETVTLQTAAQLSVQGQGPQMIADLDPLRKDLSLYPVDAPIILCHSPGQVTSPANLVTGFTAPDGAYVAQGQAVTLTGTGRVYAMCQAPTRISMISNRRGA